MTLGAAIDSYTNGLQERRYSAGETGRKQILLRRWLSYAVALHHPGLPSRLLKMTEIRLYGRGVSPEPLNDGSRWRIFCSGGGRQT